MFEFEEEIKKCGKERKITVETTILVEVSHIQRKIESILPILHVYSDLVRKITNC